MLHENAVVGDIHYLQNWSVADNTARDALSVAAADVGKVCQVTGTSTYYILTDDSPMTWQVIGGGSGSGDVVGPASSTDNAIVRFDSTTGKLIQDSGITIADGASGTLAGTNSGDVTLNASVADILGLTGQELTADDPGADRIVFWDDSAGKLTHLTVGTGLTITDTTISASGGGGGITLGTPQATTSGTAINFTGIPSGTKSIKIMISGVSTNGTSMPLFRLGTGGVATTSGYVGGIQNSSTGTTTSDGCHFYTGAGSAATLVASGELTLSLMNSSTNTWVCSGNTVEHSGAAAVYSQAVTISLAGELDMVSLTTAGGVNTFDAGSINIQYQS